MCLLKKSLLPRIAIKPVKVYKVLYSFNGNLFTPFLSRKVINKTIKARKFDIPEIFWEDRITWCGVHAFRNLVTAERAASSWVKRVVNNKSCPFVVCECIIPSFTLYWNGKEGDIAARKIKIGKRIYYKNRKFCEFASFVQGCPYTLCTALRYCPPVLCPSDFKTCDNYKKAINE